MCGVEGCDYPPKSYGLCNAHMTRKLYGRPLNDPIKRHRGRNYAALNRVITYHSAHERIKVLWGLASNYACVDCGEKARDWSYCGGDPNALVGTEGRAAGCLYSIWPEFYAPRCRKCHTVFDHGAPPPVNDGPVW